MSFLTAKEAMLSSTEAPAGELDAKYAKTMH
jgi:hypothetical protein